jgi:uncharacterized protein (TIGR01777 family)
MKVLMTGATGLIGQALGQELVRHGHQLKVVVRHPESTVLSYPAQVYSWLGNDSPFPSEALQDVEAIVNLAGESIAGQYWTAQRKKSLYESRVHSTRTLLEALENSPTRGRLKVFVQGSAIGIYGDRGSEICEENSTLGSDFLAGLCKDWEAEAARVQTFATQSRFVAIRTGLVLSEKGGALQKLLPLFAQGLGAQLGSGQQFMSWIHLDDIVGLFAFAVEDDRAMGPLNGVAPGAVPNSEFTQIFATCLKQNKFIPVPKAVLKIAMGEMSQALLFSVRASVQKVQSSGYRFKFPSLNEALQNLTLQMQARDHVFVQEQWVPRPLNEVFDFFSQEVNLEKLTPPFLNFNVVKKSTSQMQAGTLIDYKLGLHGVSIGWRTLIKEWQPQTRFVDEQLKGPYSKWHHTHTFSELGAGTLMSDRVVYRVPLGPLGAFFAGWKINQDVKKIFSFRMTKIKELFG